MLRRDLSIFFGKVSKFFDVIHLQMTTNVMYMQTMTLATLYLQVQL